MKRPLVLAFAAGAALLAAGTAHASDVHWSIGVALPPVATVVSNGPVYGAPVVVGSPYYAPAPVYAPRPVFVEPPVVYRPWYRPHYYVPARPVIVYRGGHQGRGEGRDGRWDGHGEHGRPVVDGRRWHQ